MNSIVVGSVMKYPKSELLVAVAVCVVVSVWGVVAVWVAVAISSLGFDDSDALTPPRLQPAREKASNPKGSTLNFLDIGFVPFVFYSNGNAI